MIRVCCAVGTWQQITLVAGLRQMLADRGLSAADARDVLVLYEPGGLTPALKALMARVAAAAWDWERVVWADDLLDFSRRIPQSRYDHVIGALRERVGIPPSDVEQVWLCWMNRPPEKLLMEAFPGARVFVFEDGLSTYQPVPVAERVEPAAPWTAALDRWRPVRRLRRSRWALDPRHQARLSGLFLSLSPDTPPPAAYGHAPCRFVEDRHLAETLDRVSSVLPDTREWDPVPSGARGGPAALLVLGQCLYRNNQMPRDEEAAIYQRVLDDLLARGYRLLWKEHPRALEPFFEELKARVAAPERFARLCLPDGLPVELVARRLEVAGCVSGISSSLFYLPRLCGLPCYTFVGELTSRLRGNAVPQGEMVRRAVPGIDALPPVPGAKAP